MQNARQAPANESAAAPAPLKRGLGSLLLWRGATAAGALATAFSLLAAFNLHDQMGGEIQQLQAQLRATPQIGYVAVLADNKAAASMLVTFDPRNNRLTLQRVGDYQEAGDRSLQLWALPPNARPRSLGVLGRDKLLRLSAGEADVHQVPTLAISLGPKGGMPGAGGPTGPVLFSGSLIKKML